MKKLEQIALQTDGIRKFAYGDRLVAATIADETDFVVKNHAEAFLTKVTTHNHQRGAILSCIGEHGVITQFHPGSVDGFSEDELAFNIRKAIKTFNPETECVVVHIGRDAQACVKAFSLSSLFGFVRQRILKFGIEGINLITTS